MSSKIVFHIATKKQLQQIKEGLQNISAQIWENLGKEPVNLYVRYEQYAEIYLVPTNLERQLRLIRDTENLHHTGLYFGFLKDTEFQLSLEGAEYLFTKFFRLNRIKLKAITVTEEGAKSFLYGNTLKPTDFAQAPKSLNRKDVIFVLNPKSQFIGIGFIYKREERLELRNLVDYGYYIRRGF